MGADPAALDWLVKVVTTYPGRAGAVPIAICREAAGSTEIHLDSNGRLTVPSLGLDLAAAGLTIEDAATCATLVDLTRDIPEESSPPLACAQATTVGGALAPS